jgi:hypothetical protein
MINRALWVVGLGLAVSGAVGCGNAPIAPPSSVMSNSFSPSSGTTASGAPADDLWWKYEVNGGQAEPVMANGLAGTITVADMMVHLTNGGTKRETTFGMSIALSDGATTVTGHATNQTDETLMVGPPSAEVSETMHQDQQLSGNGMSIHETIQSTTMPSMPLVDFGDHPDLDSLPVGHADQATVHLTVNALVTASAPGQMPQSDAATTTSDGTVTWTVVAQLPSMDVLGKSYQRVTEMQVQTNATEAQTGMTTSSTVTNWLAAGIGIIRSEGAADAQGTTLTEELIDTDLGLQ